MSNILRLTPGQANAGGLISAGFTATDFNSLANGSFVLATTAIDNTANLDLWAMLSGSFVVGGTTTAQSYMSLWLLPLNQNGANYGDGTPTGSVLPSTAFWLQSVGPRTGITSGTAGIITFPDSIALPRAQFKFGISNHLGVALNAAAAAACQFSTTNLNNNG